MRRVKRQVPNEGWRWLALLIVLINVSFNYVLETYLPGTTVVQAGSDFQSLFAPASFSHLIWMVIGFSLVVYAIYQVLPAQSEEGIYDDLAKPFVLANGFSMAWVAAVRAGIYPLALASLAATLVAALIMYIRVRDSVLRDDHSNWLSVPFSLLAGWLSMMTISFTAVLFISLGIQGTLSTQIIWTVIMILAAVVMGIGVCFRCRDFIFPAVVGWALIGIFVSRQGDFPYVGVVGLVGAVIPLIWIVTTLVRRISYRQRIWANKLSF
jgi:hypothetical protein